MKQRLQLKIGQQLSMTPQLQQAIRLLQLSSLELRQEIQQALWSNPMLELAEELDEESAPAVEAESQAEEALGGDGAAEEIPEELPVDARWEDIFPANAGGGGDEEERDFEAFHRVTETLRDHLLWQLNLTPMSPTDRVVAEAIIDAVDEDGFLSLPIDEIHAGLAELGLDREEVLAVLHRVQQFDPPGVAATSLAECLAIQLRQLDPTTPWRGEALRLVEAHLELVAQRDYPRLARLTGLPPEALEGAVALIRSLNPHPGERIGGVQVEYVIPDVQVVKENGAWRVSLNPEVTPRLALNRHYAALVRRADDSSDNRFLRTQLQEARWFLRSLESRNETLLKVAACIVELQRGFLERGPEAMRPLILADVAERLGLHESTVSRVTTHKYIETPRGVFELKYFFSSHVATDDGGECSATAIRAMLRKMIDAEDPARPLSDAKLAEQFAARGIQVARRTVAKYREALGIPTAAERKRFKQGIRP
ncbi:MAG: RNA polymerase sigma-54 factor [Porticoccaceae bacterium]|nr:MAG: RNA polymerase sigma-54 factor [Porticoccaceae bacterium]